MKAQRIQRPDVILSGSYEANPRNLGDCRTRSYDDMLKDYQRIYGAHYTMHELKRMHNRWKQIAASL